MEQSKIIKTLDKYLGKGFDGEAYEFEVYSVNFRLGSYWEFIVIRTNWSRDIYVSDKMTGKIENDLNRYLYSKYQHDDVFIHIENKFNTGLVITMSY